MLPTALRAQTYLPPNSDSARTVRYTPGLQLLDAKNGFRAIKLGTPRTTIKGLVRADVPDGDTTFYRRPTDAKKLGPYEPARITHVFYHDKLMAVFLQIEGEDNAMGIMETLQKLYGPSTDAQEHSYNKNSIPQQWMGKQVLLKIEQGASADEANVFFLSKPMLRLVDADQKNAKQRAVKDL